MALRIYRVIRWPLLIVTWLLLIALSGQILTSPDILHHDDFVEYWAAGRLNAEGHNPYDPAELLPLERAAGRPTEVAVMMWNPPWTLALAMPFGMVPYPIARALWFLTMFLILAKSFEQIGRALHPGRNPLWFWLLGFAFEPPLEGLRTGQISPLLLAGAVGVWTLIYQRPMLAGAMAVLLTVKPHASYLILLALALWTVDQRRWEFFLGFLGGLGGSLAIAMLFNPSVIGHYLHAWRNYPPVDWATATPGGILRFYLGIERFELQFVSAAVGILWFALHWLRHRSCWDWRRELPLLAVISPVTAAYGWTSDLVLTQLGLIPAVFRILLRSGSTTPQIARLGLLGAWLLINGVTFATSWNQLWYFWFGPSLLLWYVIAQKWLAWGRGE
jgi:hypothetical protein